MKILFFTWENLLEFHFPLANRLSQRGAEVVFLVQDQKGLDKCSAHGQKYIKIQDIHCYTCAEKRFNKWWSLARKDSPEPLTYKGFNLWHLSEYERKLCQEENLKDIYHRVIMAIESAESVIDYVKPQVFILWNGLTIPTRVYAEVARKSMISVFFSERGYFPGTVIIDEKGVNYGSSFASDWGAEEQERSLSFEEKGRLEKFLTDYHLKGETIVKGDPIISRAEICKQFQIPGSKKIILYLAQIDYDTNIILYSPFFKENIAVLQELADVVSRLEYYHLIVKLHPEDQDKTDPFKTIVKDKGTIVKGINLHSLLRLSDVVVVRNSTIGLEALTYYKPVITLGNAIYSHKGVTYDVTSKKELEDYLVLVSVKDEKIDSYRKGKVDRYLFKLLDEYLYFLDDSKAFGRSNEYIVERLMKTAQKNKNNNVPFGGIGFSKIAIKTMKSHLHKITCR